jgi:hypothetical protein
MRYLIAPLFLAVLSLCSCQTNTAKVAPVLVSTAKPPTGVKSTNLGELRYSDVYGYRKCHLVYGNLADQARAIGANAVLGVTGYHRPSPFSWAVPVVQGVAYRFDNPDDIKSIPGAIYETAPCCRPEISMSLFPPVIIRKVHTFTTR